MDVNKLTGSDLYRFAEQWMRANPGKSLADFRRVTGYNGSPLKVKDTKTGRIGPRFKDTDKARNQRLQAAEQEYVDTLKQGGYSEAEGQQMLQSSTSKHKKLQKQVRSLNKEKGAGSFSVGHMTATEQGGGNFNRNLRLEIGKSKGGNRGNFSRAAKDEIPKSLKPALGIPNSGREAAIMDMSGGQFDLPLTPRDRQQIIRNPQMADEIIGNRLQIVESKARGPAKLRKIKALGLAGRAVAPAVIGAALIQGGPAEAAITAAETLTPLGDISGGNLAPGTVQAEQARAEEIKLQAARQAAHQRAARKTRSRNAGFQQLVEQYTQEELTRMNTLEEKRRLDSVRVR